MAVADDESLLAVPGRYTDPQNQILIRIRPITGRPAALTNLSVRGSVLTDADPLIVGFVTRGTGTSTALVRAAGPSLTALGVGDAMADPRMDFLRDRTVVASNDNWQPSLSQRFASVGAFAFELDSRDAALETNVESGNYPALVVPAVGAAGTCYSNFITRPMFLAARADSQTSRPGAASVLRSHSLPVSASPAKCP